MLRRSLVTLALVAAAAAHNTTDHVYRHPHTGHHEKRRTHHVASHHHQAKSVDAVATASVETPVVAVSKASSKHTVAASTGNQIMMKLKALEAKVATKVNSETSTAVGTIQVNGPVPHDFEPRFQQEVAKATGCEPHEVTVVSSTPMRSAGGGSLVQVVFKGPSDVVEDVKEQVSDPDSRLANGSLRPFFVAKSGAGEEEAPEEGAEAAEEPAEGEHAEHAEHAEHDEHEEKAEGSIDIDTAMPYGDLEPFGREDTAQELTESSVKESDDMVDQLERAEVAEEKRAVFRALTRLRGVAITSYDSIARAQTGNVDQYAKTHKWRDEHPVRHLAEEESDIKKWAFPNL